MAPEEYEQVIHETFSTKRVLTIGCIMACYIVLVYMLTNLL
jgi:hypothetical protein